MKWQATCLFICFAGFPILYGLVLTLKVEDKGFLQYTRRVYFGTNEEHQVLDISLTIAETSVTNDNCIDKYGVCKPYCTNDELCELYCSPMCCIDTTKLDCYNTTSLGYTRNSTSFTLLKDYWKSGLDSACGVWVEDDLFFADDTITQHVRVDMARFALKVVDARYFGETAQLTGVLGFGRDPSRPCIVQQLHQQGIIDQPVVTIFYKEIFEPYYILGEYSEQFCDTYRDEIDVIGDHAWMFDAMSAAFFNFASEHKFRMILTSKGVIHMPRQVLLGFLQSGLLIRHDFRYATYVLNQTVEETFRFSFKVNPKLTLFTSERSIDISRVLDPNSKIVMFEAAPIDPNPDQVEWMMGRPFLVTSCVFLDYERRKIAFAEQLEPDYYD